MTENRTLAERIGIAGDILPIETAVQVVRFLACETPAPYYMVILEPDGIAVRTVSPTRQIGGGRGDNEANLLGHVLSHSEGRATVRPVGKDPVNIKWDRQADDTRLMAMRPGSRAGWASVPQYGCRRH